MCKYYKIHGHLYEGIGNGIFKCIASTRKDMIGVMEIKPNTNKPWILPVKNKHEAIYWMKQDAYWENLKLYTDKNL